MPSDDDGGRDDPLLSNNSNAVTDYRIDPTVLSAAQTRIVIGVGEESEGVFTGRTSVAIARMLDQEPVVFPSHHGGFAAEDAGYPGKAGEFARRLHEVLDERS